MKNQILFKLLSNYYSLYLTTQSYHWNVQGADFITLHNVFEEQYNSLLSDIDEVAEKIRILGEKVPASFSNFQSNTAIKNPNENFNSHDMINDLKDGYKIIISLLDDVLKAYTEHDTVLDLAVQKKAKAEKTLWILSSLSVK